MARKKRSKAKGGGAAAATTVAGDGTGTNEVEPANESTTGNETGSIRRRGKSNGKAKNQPAQVAVRLADQPGKLTKADLTCPICWSIFLAPTTLPCNHSLCEGCFRKHVDETSMSCPCCRMRLSIWCRKNMKNNQLLDEPLWNRMKKEFPKAVAARINGEDSQNIMEECEDDSFSDSLPELKNSGRPLFDGTLCEDAGEIRQELQQMMKQHEKDLEAERQREETASASLIQQIQDEEGVPESNVQEYEEQDFILAQKLQQEFEAEERLQRTRRSTQQEKSHPKNPLKKWMNNNNNNYSPDICELSTAVQSKVKPLRTSLVSNSSKAKKNVKKKTNSQAQRKSSSTITSLNVSKASQNVMSKFLSSSQNNLSPESPNSSARSQGSIQPCCSKSLPVHDVRFSAFSPTKPSTNMRLIVPAESLAIPISVAAVANFSPILGRSTEELGTNTKTPDSINSEVDRHFRPIRGAPKTPPRRRPDGTFLPEPKLLRTTPMKPGSSTSIAAYICSPLKQMTDGGKPSSATIEKRISNDSGRASDDSRSPDVDGIGQSPATSVKGSDNSSITLAQSYQNNERGCISEDYRVTPEDNPRTPENSKKRLHGDDRDNKTSWDNKKIKIESMEEAGNSSRRNKEITKKLVKTETESPIKIKVESVSKDHQVKEEAGSPNLLDETFNSHVSLSFDSYSQGTITIDEDDEYLGLETEALETFRKKAEQEAADRAFAEALQRDLNRGIRSPRGRNSKEKYSLRSWLNNPQIKREVKKEN